MSRYNSSPPSLVPARLARPTPESSIDRLARIDPAIGIALTLDEIAGLLRRPRSRPLVGPAEILRVLSEPT
jgi:hypothetical protein